MKLTLYASPNQQIEPDPDLYEPTVKVVMSVKESGALEIDFENINLTRVDRAYFNEIKKGLDSQGIPPSFSAQLVKQLLDHNKQLAKNSQIQNQESVNNLLVPALENTKIDEDDKETNQEQSLSTQSNLDQQELNKSLKSIFSVTAYLNIKKELDERGIKLNKNSKISEEMARKIDEVASEMVKDLAEEAQRQFMAECEHQQISGDSSEEMFANIANNLRIRKRTSYILSKRVKNFVKATSDLLEKDLKIGLQYAYERLKLAEGKNCHPKDLLSPDDMMDQLIKEEAEEKKAQKLQNYKKLDLTKPEGIKKKTNLNTNKKKRSSTQASYCKPVPVVVAASDKSSFIMKLFDSSLRCVEHPRVQRWATQDFSEIRRFTDKNENNQILHRYQDLDDATIEEQRARHFLPGVERLIHAPYKDIYTFPTDRGCGLIAQLQFKDKIVNGIIYLGVDKNKVIFHKYFEDVKFEQNKNNIFLDQKKEANPDSKSMVSNFNFELDIADDYALNFDYSGHSENDYSVRILPVRKDLINQK